VGSVQWNNSGAFGGSANLTWDITNSRLGVGTAGPFNPLTIAGGSHPASDAGSGVGGFSLSSGTGAQTDDNLLMGVHTGDYGWIQAIKAGTASRNLILNPQGGSIGISTVTPSALLDVAGFIRSTGTAGSPTTGVGVEVLWNTTFGIIQAYDRGASAYKPLYLDAAPVVVGRAQSGSSTPPIISCGLNTAGTSGFTGNYQLFFYMSTSTSLTICAKCSDGAVRQTTLTLA
jgi:hypothetical protein